MFDYFIGKIFFGDEITKIDKNVNESFVAIS